MAPAALCGHNTVKDAFRQVMPGLSGVSVFLAPVALLLIDCVKTFIQPTIGRESCKKDEEEPMKQKTKNFLTKTVYFVLNTTWAVGVGITANALSV